MNVRLGDVERVEQAGDVVRPHFHVVVLDRPVRLAVAAHVEVDDPEVLRELRGGGGEVEVAESGAVDLDHGLALTGDKRSHTMPDVPTLAEQGFPGFSAFAWWGIFAPAGTPKPILDKFHAELVKALGQPDLRKQLTETLGMDLASSSPEALQKFLVSEINRWGNVVRSNNVRAD